MRVVVAIVGIVVAALAWLLGLFGRRQPHPHLLRSHRQRLDLQAISASARAGLPFSLQLGPRSVQVQVQPTATAAAEQVVVDAEGQLDRNSGGEPATYAGQVSGIDDSEVRLSITADQVSGYVALPDEWWFIEPLRKFAPAAEVAEHITYRTSDLRFRMEFGDDALPVKERGEGGSDPPHRVNPTIGVVMLADRQYEQQAQISGLSWHRQQAGLVNQLNGLYARIGVELQIRMFILDRRTTSLTATFAEDLIDQMENPIQLVIGDMRQLTVRQSSNAEIAHLVTGKNLDGNTLGVAWRPGVYGLSQQQLFWIGGGGGFGGGPNLAFQNMMIAAHEIGHNFNGLHEQADEWCHAHFIWCWDYRRSIMWRTFYDDNQPIFSDGSRASGRNNRRRLLDNMASGRNRNF